MSKSDFYFGSFCLAIFLSIVIIAVAATTHSKKQIEACIESGGFPVVAGSYGTFRACPHFQNPELIKKEE